MRKAALVILAVALAAIVAVAGCVSTPAEENNSPIGVWIDDKNNQLTLDPLGNVQVIVNNGNTYTGTWATTENGIEIKDLTAITRMIVSDDEKAFVASLVKVSVTKTETEETLTATSVNGKSLSVFSKMITGTWVTDDGIIVTLNADGTYTATTAANIIFGTYSYTENGIEFAVEDSGATMALGTEEEMAAENAFKEALAATKGYAVIDGKLTFLDADGKAVSTLIATPFGIWTDGYVNIELAADGTVTLVPGALAENGGNTYKGTYEYADDKITLKDFMAITNMIVSEDEKAYIAAIGNTLTADNQFLTVADKDGKVTLAFHLA